MNFSQPNSTILGEWSRGVWRSVLRPGSAPTKIPRALLGLSDAAAWGYATGTKFAD
jgi:hypothetical protein